MMELSLMVKATSERKRRKMGERERDKGKTKTVAAARKAKRKAGTRAMDCGFAEGARAAAGGQAQVRASQALHSCPRKHPKPSSQVEKHVAASVTPVKFGV